MKSKAFLIASLATSVAALTACKDQYHYDVDKFKNKYRNERHLSQAFKLDQQEFALRRELRDIPNTQITRNANSVTVRFPADSAFREGSSELRSKGQTILTKLAHVFSHFNNGRLWVSPTGQGTLTSRRSTAIKTYLASRHVLPQNIRSTSTSTEGSNWMTIRFENTTG